MPVAPSTPLYVEVVTARGAVWPARFMARSERRFALVRWMAYKEGHDTDQLSAWLAGWPAGWPARDKHHT
jgi:hypothetical protein